METSKGSFSQLSIIFEANKTSDNRHYRGTVCFFMLAFFNTVAMVSIVASGVIFFGQTQSSVKTQTLCCKESLSLSTTKTGSLALREVLLF